MTGEVPVRTRAMEDLVERMDRAAGTVRPNLAVRFAADPNVPQVNRHGVVQYGCTFVGECVIGCNQGAKNSLDLQLPGHGREGRRCGGDRGGGDPHRTMRH